MVGRNRSTVANLLRLLKLPAEVQALVHERKLTEGHARALLALDRAGGDDRARRARRRTRAGRCARSRRASAASAARRHRGPPRIAAPRASRAPVPSPPTRSRVEDALRKRLGTDVRVTPAPGPRASSRISYYSNDDLARLLELILGRPFAGMTPRGSRGDDRHVQPDGATRSQHLPRAALAPSGRASASLARPSVLAIVVARARTGRWCAPPIRVPGLGAAGRAARGGQRQGPPVDRRARQRRVTVRTGASNGRRRHRPRPADGRRLRCPWRPPCSPAWPMRLAGRAVGLSIPRRWPLDEPGYITRGAGRNGLQRRGASGHRHRGRHGEHRPRGRRRDRRISWARIPSTAASSCSTIPMTTRRCTATSPASSCSRARRWRRAR